MQAFPISRNQSTPIKSVRTAVMPSPKVQKFVVVQPVNLRPMGNTVSMTVPHENPFTGGRRISIHTQVSGGMAQADPSQRSRRSFVPGFSGLGGEFEDKAYSAFNQLDPDAKNMDRAAYDASPKRTYWEGEQRKWDAAAAAKSSANWSKAGDIFATTLTQASTIATDINKTKQMALQAQIAEAKARQAQIEQAGSAAYMARLTDVSQYGAGMAARKGITIPLLIIGGGALAVALFLFLKKKNAAAAA
jgi:hypothetical protein